MLPPSRSPDTRRHFLRRLGLLSVPLIFGGAGSYAYGSLLERHRLTVERHELAMDLGPRAPRSFRLVSLTDFHFDPLYEVDFIAECVRRTNELKPDLVLLTGDYISTTSHRFSEFAELLSTLRPTCGVFASMGNHDYWHHPTRILTAFRKAGIDTLQNQHSRVTCNGGELVLAGLESAWAAHPNWGKASHGVKPDERVLALVHEPDMADQLASDSRVAVQFSGHTHGGQVRAPFLGALRLPSWGKRYQSGFYDVGNLKLYVNRGIGTIEHHVRFLCPPEIACFEVTNTAP